jgi:hypothetical protein
MEGHLQATECSIISCAWGEEEFYQVKIKKRNFSVLR